MDKFQSFVGNTIKHIFNLDFCQTTYSQEGEDLVLQRIFSMLDRGFYVDIGAHHPKRFSNTYLLYRKGWRGINIDAMPGSMSLFNKVRPRDINLEIGVSDNPSVHEFHAFSEKALSTFDAKLAEEKMALGWKKDRTLRIPLSSINSILEEYLPEQTPIDLLSIDIEGLDEKVLFSMDYSRYLPHVIVCEVLKSSVDNVMKSPFAAFLIGKGYSLYSKLHNSCIWKFANNL